MLPLPIGQLVCPLKSGSEITKKNTSLMKLCMRTGSNVPIMHFSLIHCGMKIVVAMVMESQNVAKTFGLRDNSKTIQASLMKLGNE